MKKSLSIAIGVAALAIGGIASAPASASAATCEVSITLPGGNHVWVAVTGSTPRPACSTVVRLAHAQSWKASSHSGISGSASANRTLYVCTRNYNGGYRAIVRGNRFRANVRSFARGFCGHAV